MSSEEEQTITVTTESPVTVPGGELRAVVTITGDPDDKVRGATARLVRTALRRVTETNVTSHGYHNSLWTDDVVISESPLTDTDGKVPPGTHTVNLTLPDDALPSAPKVVSWSVEAVIDRRHGRDVNAKAAVEVLAGPDRFADEATGEGWYHGERCLELELPIRTLRPGDTISGTVLIQPAQAMTLTNQIVAFTRTDATKDGTDTTAVVVRELLDGPLVLQAGDTRTYPFELTLPDDAAPTVLGTETTPPCTSHISYAVTAVAEPVRSPENKNEGNPAINLPVNVYNAEVTPSPG